MAGLGPLFGSAEEHGSCTSGHIGVKEERVFRPRYKTSTHLPSTQYPPLWPWYGRLFRSLSDASKRFQERRKRTNSFEKEGGFSERREEGKKKGG